ncbi:MAG: aldolase/citrate lyase family protein [Burkholderiales bacterium]|nr:aldolase/citrate lyase family protein [Burkholderiales bacterium]
MSACYFFVPALKLDSLYKITSTRKIKMIVVDIEDSTSDIFKSEAREKISKFDFTNFIEAGIKIGIRINCIHNLNGLKDVLFLNALDKAGKNIFQYIYLPKINNSAEFQVYRSLFSKMSSKKFLVSIIETINAVENITEIAKVSDALCLGQADLSAKLYKNNKFYLDYARATICAAAANQDILVIATNSFEFNDLSVLKKDCISFYNEGFTGMAAIHPDQIQIINEVFNIPDSEIASYNACIEDYNNNAGSGFVIRGSKVIAPPFVEKARTMIKLALNLENN